MIELLNNDLSCGAEELMNTALRDGAKIREEYPLVFEEEFDGRVISLEEQGVTQACCAILERDFLVERQRVKGGLIGSVVTAPEFRVQGKGTHLLIQAEAALQIQGCAFAVLWAENPKWYIDRGYGPMSSEHTFLINRDLVASLPELEEVRSMLPGDAKAIHSLYQRHSVRVERSLEETEALLDCPDMLVLVSVRQGKVAAYACMGRGRDLQGAVHEWGGSSHEILGLLRAYLEIAYPDGRPFETVIDPETGNEVPVAEQILLMAPPSAVDLCLRLESLGVPSMHSMLALGKILDRNAAAKLLNEVIGKAGSVEVTDDPQRPFLIQGRDKQGTLDDEGVFALLFGVPEVQQDVRNFLREFGLENSQLPLEPFAWGLDSF